MRGGWLGVVSAVVVCLLAVGGTAHARGFILNRSSDVADFSEEERVLEDFMTDSENGIPPEILRDAVGVCIFPVVRQASWGRGIGGGQGIVVRRYPGGDWSPPAYYRFRTVSTGFQIGVQEMDIILLVMDDERLRDILDADITLGGSVAVTAGPTSDAYDVNEPMRSDAILSYVKRTRGAYVGVSVSGSRITPDDDANEDAYGDGITTEEIMYDAETPRPEGVDDLLDALDEYTDPDYTIEGSGNQSDDSTRSSDGEESSGSSSGRRTILNR